MVFSLTTDRDDLVTVNILCCLWLAVPHFWMSGTNQQGFDVNGPQEKDQYSLAKKYSVLTLILEDGDGQLAYCYPLPVSYLLYDVTLHLLPWKGGVLLPPTEVGLVLCLGVVKMNGRRDAGPALRWWFCPSSRNSVKKPGATRWRTITKRTDKAPQLWASQIIQPPANQQPNTDARGSPAKTRKTVQLSPQGCSKPPNSGVVCQHFQS